MMKMSHVLTRSALLTAVLTAIAAPAAAKGAPDGAGEGAPLELVVFEDQASAVELPFKPTGLVVASPATHGTVAIDADRVVYLPAPDYHGSDQFSIASGRGAAVDVRVSIMPVNDAPSFTPGAGRAHVEDTRDAFEVPGWATAVSAGPPDEAAWQTVSFVATPASDPSGVLKEVSIDPDGTLRYFLTGANGIAEVDVSLHDGDTGSESLAAHRLRIGVGQVTDLAIERMLDVGTASRGGGSYRLVVSQLSGGGVAGALVTEVMPLTVGASTWTCVAYDGAECHSKTGEGPVDAKIDMKAGSFVVFYVDAANALLGGTSYSAFVVQPDVMIDSDPSNNQYSQ